MSSRSTQRRVLEVPRSGDRSRARILAGVPVAFALARDARHQAQGENRHSDADPEGKEAGQQTEADPSRVLLEAPDGDHADAKGW